MLNGSLTMSVTFPKFCFLSRSWATGYNFTIRGSPRLRSHKSAMHYSLFCNVYHAKTYPGILNISLSRGVGSNFTLVKQISQAYTTFNINYYLFLWFTNDYWSGGYLVCLACSSTPAEHLYSPSIAWYPEVQCLSLSLYNAC